MKSTRRFYRSRKNHAIAGVFGGIADYFGWDANIVRIITIVVIVFTVVTLPAVGLVYVITWAIVPLEPTGGATIIDADR